MHLPTEDRYIQTKAELEDELAVVLGGRAAEEVIFSQISTGASNDFMQATRIAGSMVKDFGMSNLGVVSYEDEGQSRFLRQISGSMPQYSERTAAEIDREVRSIISARYEHVKKLLDEKKPFLEAVARRLLDTESISSEELHELVKNCESSENSVQDPLLPAETETTPLATQEDAT
jgi:cell division protease FtsH